METKMLRQWIPTNGTHPITTRRGPLSESEQKRVYSWHRDNNGSAAVGAAIVRPTPQLVCRVAVGAV